MRSRFLLVVFEILTDRATGILALIRTASGSVLTAVFLAILSSKVPKQIASHVPPAALEAGLPSSSLSALFTALAAGTPTALSNVPGMTAAIETAVADAMAEAYAGAYAYVYYATIAVGAVGLIAVFAIKDYDSMLTTHVSRQIYKRGEAEQQQTAKGGDSLHEQGQVESNAEMAEVKAHADIVETTPAARR